MVYWKFYCILVSDSTRDGQTKLWIGEIVPAVFWSGLATNCNSLSFLTYSVNSLLYEKINYAEQRYSFSPFYSANACDIHLNDGWQIHC